MTEVAAGTVLDGRYKVLSRLGSGGMADVFLAEDEQLQRKVALKLLHRRFAQDPDFVERFRREAQAAAGLQHPNVVSVYDRGTFDGTYYIAMEYLPGQSLKQLIRSQAPLDPIRAIDITIQILKAARFAHRRGIIHRDLKPHNVIVDDADQVKVTDFGIARAGASDMTETGSIMGTAQYLSPEQAQGHAVSAASDLYAIGVVLYELLTGRVPFDAESAVTIALKHVAEAPAAPGHVNPAVPPELEQIVMWALNKNPADRPADADEFIQALEDARAAILSPSRGQMTASMAALSPAGAHTTAAYAAAAAPIPVGVGYGHDGTQYVDGEPLPEDPEDPRRAWPWLILLLVLLLAGGGVAAYLLLKPSQQVVPNVVGKTLPAASAVLENDGFNVNTVNVTSNSAAGTVIRQSPSGGNKAKNGSTITVTASSGPGDRPVPPVVNFPLAKAKAAIQHAGLKVGSVQKQTSATVPAGSVISTTPPAGQNVPAGSQVELFVSAGQAKLFVPDETGSTLSTARAALEPNFHVVVVDQTTTSAPDGTVIAQSPRGTDELPGTTVTLTVAKAPTTASVPSVTGDGVGTATGQLVGAGFQVNQVVKPVKRLDRDGIVLSQNPGSGAVVKKGSVVTIVVGQYTPSSTTTSTTTTPTTSTPTGTTT
jgi:eukaryotic-like serine/threonine-protein kinase